MNSTFIKNLYIYNIKMDDNIFADRQQRELQNLRQRGASNVVRINPDLKLFTQRFNPDVSRAALLQAQRARAVLDKSELEKIEGVKTAKKLKKRRGKNLRGEVARNLREQRRFERGERRDRPEQEPRIVGDPIPAAPGAPAAPAAPAADPNAQLRLAIEGRRIAAQDAQQRRLVDAVMARDDRERQERQEILGRQADERQAIIGRGEAERQAILDREAALSGEERQERLAILDREGQERLAILDRQARLTAEERAERLELQDRAQAERLELRGGFRTILEGESRFNREERARLAGQAAQERQDILDQAGDERAGARIASQEERTALLRAGRVERDALIQDRQQLEQSQEAIRQRVEEQRLREIRDERQERDALLQRGSAALERLGDEQQRERIQREDQQAAAQVAERTRQAAERQQVSVQAAEEREGILRLTLDTDRPQIPPPGNTQADRDFLQRQFQQGFDEVDRRIGESEARTAEQIRQHADRVAAVERQPPIVINQPAEARPAPVGPSAEDIASAVRQQLESPSTRERRVRRETRRRVSIQEQTTDSSEEDFSPTRSERRRQREGRGAVSPDVEDRELIPREERPIGFEPVAPGQEEAEGFSPVQSPRTTRTPQSTGIDPPVFVSQAEAGGAPEPAQEREQVSERGFRIGGTPPTTGELIGQAARNIAGGAVGTKNTIVEGISGALGFGEQEEGVVAEPAQRPTQRIPQLEQRPVEDDFSPERDLNLPPQRQPPAQPPAEPPAELGGSGILVDPRNLPQEIEPVAPAIQQLQSAEPQRRIAPVETDAQELARLQRELSTAKQKERQLLRGREGGGRGQRSGRFAQTGGDRELKPLQADIQRLERLVEVKESIIGVGGGGSAARGVRQAVRQAGGLVETEEEAEAQPRQGVSQRNTNFRLYESIIPEIEGHYTRGRAQGGARGTLPFQITNTTDRKFKGLGPGQTIMIDQVESSGALGYYPRGRTGGSKAGITRIGRKELEKQIKAGKLKLDRTR